MDRTLKEELVFSSLMTVGMVSIMTAYNTILTAGLNAQAAASIVTQFIPILLIAVVVEHLLVSHNAHKVHRLIVSPQDSQAKYVIVLSLLMASGMCASMTFFTTLVHVGTEDHFTQHYFSALARNYPMALFAQLAIVGPLVRSVHMRLFRPAVAPATINS